MEYNYDVGVKTCQLNLRVYNVLYLCISAPLYEARCSKNSVHTLARTGTDAGSEAMHTRMYACFGGGRIESLYQSS